MFIALLRMLSHSTFYCVACYSPRRGVRLSEQRRELTAPSIPQLRPVLQALSCLHYSKVAHSANQSANRVVEDVR